MDVNFPELVRDTNLKSWKPSESILEGYIKIYKLNYKLYKYIVSKFMILKLQNPKNILIWYKMFW